MFSVRRPLSLSIFPYSSLCGKQQRVQETTFSLSASHFYQQVSELDYIEFRVEKVFQIEVCQTKEQISASLQLILNALDMTAVFLNLVCICLCMVEFKHAFMDATANCVEWQCFSEVSVVLCSDCDCVFYHSMPPQGSKITGFYFWVSVYCRRKFLFDIMHCRWIYFYIFF